MPLRGTHPLALAACVLVACSPASASLARVPTVALSNGVQMPAVALGMGPWCNNARCPAPAKPCGDCYNDTGATEVRGHGALPHPARSLAPRPLRIARLPCAVRPPTPHCAPAA